MKVYGGDLFWRGKQWHVVVAANSQRRVAEITGLSLYYIRNWWCETGNDREITQAHRHPFEITWMREM